MNRVGYVALYSLGLTIGMVLCGIFVAFLVYLYPHAPVFLNVLCFFEALILFSAAIGIFGMLSSDPKVRSRSGGAIIGAIAIYIVNSYIIYLSSAWSITFGPDTSLVILFPHRAIEYLGAFFSALFQAILGIEIAAPRLAVGFPASPDATNAVAITIQWFLDTFWNIVLGVVSGVIVASVLRKKAER